MKPRQPLLNPGLWAGLWLLALGAFFLRACLLGADTLHFLNADHACKAVYADYFLSRLPFGGGPGFELPIIIESSYKALPIMFHEYVGMAFVFLSVPFAIVFKLLHLPWSMAMYLAITGLLTLACVFYTVSKMLDRTTALLAVSFLATNTVYIHSVREGLIREEIFQVFGLWAGLACLCRSQAGKNRPWVWAGLFVFGFALWGKLMFLGYIFGALAGLLLLPSEKGIRLGRDLFFPSPRAAAACAAAFTAGCAPMLYSYARFKIPILKILFNYLFTRDNVFRDTGLRTWDNLNLPANLVQRGRDLYLYAAGTLYNDPLSTNTALWSRYLLLAAVLWALGRAVFAKKNQNTRNFFIFTLSSYAVLMALSCFVLGAYSKGHIIIMTPFAELVCAAALADCARTLIKNRPLRISLLAAALMLWAAPQNAKTNHYLNALRNKDGYIHYKNDLAPVLAYIETTGADSFLYPDHLGWGFKMLSRDLPVRLITPDAVEFFLSEQGGRNWFLLLNNANSAPFLARLEDAGAKAARQKTFLFNPLHPEMELYAYKITSRAREDA